MNPETKLFHVTKLAKIDGQPDHHVWLTKTGEWSRERGDGSWTTENYAEADAKRREVAAPGEDVYTWSKPTPEQRERWLKNVEGRIKVTFDRETDGRVIAEVRSMPGVMAYGASEAEAEKAVRALAHNVIAERLG